MNQVDSLSQSQQYWVAVLRNWYRAFQNRNDRAIEIKEGIVQSRNEVPAALSSQVVS